MGDMMERNLKKIIQIVCIYTGVILGAGFASGQEIMNFFIKYGEKGVLGLILAGFLFALIGFFVMDIIHDEKITSHEQLISRIMGKHLGTAMTIAVEFFLFILLCTMFAAAGAVIKQAFGLPYSVGVVMVAIGTFITLLYGVKGIADINIILAPIMVIGIIFIGVYTFLTADNSAFSNFGMARKIFYDNFIASAFIYVSYNIITAIAVFASIHQLIINKKVAFYSGVGGGIIMTILGFCIFVPLFLNYGGVINFEIPMLVIVSKYGKLMQYIYLVILLAAIFTTAISNAFAVEQQLAQKLKISNVKLNLAMITLAVIISHLGFSNFVGKIYPIFGYIGMFEIIIILIYVFVRPRDV